MCIEWVGPNYQLLAIFGLVFATAWQTQNVRIGAGVGGFFYIGSAFYGTLMWRAGLRKVPLYWPVGVKWTVVWELYFSMFICLSYRT